MKKTYSRYSAALVLVIILTLVVGGPNITNSFALISSGDGGPAPISDPSANTNTNTNIDPTAPSPDASSTAINNFFKTTAATEMYQTENFLKRNKVGLYTPDPRTNIGPDRERMRLIVDTQAHGYLNLYTLTQNKKYLQEAEDRFDYIVAVQNNVQDVYNGQIGYTMLTAYQFDPKPEYLAFGKKVADVCTAQVTFDAMNWALMCSMTDAKMFQITGDAHYRDESRRYVRLTAIQQYDEGSFPHWNGYIPSPGYTSWMIYEMDQIRKEDPGNPDIDLMLIRSSRYIANRVSAEGVLDGKVAYYVPGQGMVYNDETGGPGDSVSLSYIMRYAGYNDKAMAAAQAEFKRELTGSSTGSYPDGWAIPQPSPWTNDTTSVLRTSLIFWFLTGLQLMNGSTCPSATPTTCTITPSNCNAAFADLQSCGLNTSGTNRCLGGTMTGCMNESLVKYTFDNRNLVPSFCTKYPYCYQAEGTKSHKKCINTSCSPYFLDEPTTVNICGSTPAGVCLER